MKAVFRPPLTLFLALDNCVSDDRYQAITVTNTDNFLNEYMIFLNNLLLEKIKIVTLKDKSHDIPAIIKNKNVCANTPAMFLFCHSLTSLVALVFV